MPVTSQSWRLYAGAALIVWAAGLQYSMWSLQKRPEYKEKIEKPALERSLQDDSEPKEKTQWSVRTRF
ncbi:g4835 [Coccomyxa viridis]|uniref:G4835 protein n=1 Tax=Coccomyxa viridis TaxID=1274662 RepID=A0ABP1FY71_9CHLO